MQGKATLFGHPIHPIVIPFPIAFFVGALVSDIVLIGFGIVGALIAAVFGFLDFFR